MAKIEIFETEDDVKREALKATKRRAGFAAEIGINTGFFFTAMGVFDIIFDKIGLTADLRRSKLSKFLHKYDPFPKSVNAWLGKHGRAAEFCIGGAFLLLGTLGMWKVTQTEIELAKLDKEEKHVIVPDNLSTAALGQIPIGSVDTFKLHKIAPEKITSHAERLLQDVSAEATRTP